MLSTPIYKRDSTGNIRFWQSEVEGAQWRSLHGIMGGAVVTTAWTTCVPASKPTAALQAVFEAAAEEKKKLDRDYRLTIEEVGRSAELIQFHVYDLPSHAVRNFSDRSQILRSFDAIWAGEWAGKIVLVDTDEASTAFELDALYGDYLAAGYEGQMVRADAPYEEKRSKTLLKRKEFLDAEYPVVAIEAGNGAWSGLAKRVTCRLPDGRTFGAGIKGTQEAALALISGPKPDTATLRYFALTPDGIPRFGVATAFHEGARL